MIVIVDTNEQATNPKVVDSLKKYFKSVVIANISSDIQIPLDDGSVLAIERKTPTDFLRSIRDREIFSQIETMACDAKYSAIVITGYIGLDSEYITIDDKSVDWEGKEWKWTSASIDGIFTAIQWSGCALKFCSPEYYPRMIESLYTTANKPEKRQGLKQNRIITFPPLDNRVQMLAQWTGLKHAESLLKFARNIQFIRDEEDEYGTLANAICEGTILGLYDKNSRPEHWGAKSILQFRNQLGLENNQYLKIDTEE